MRCSCLITGPCMKANSSRFPRAAFPIRAVWGASCCSACRRNLVLAAPLRGDWARARALGGRPEMNVGVLWDRLKGLMRRREFDEELQKEIAAHLELATAENLRRGMPPEEARRLPPGRLRRRTPAPKRGR